jgi:hypothetical protein
VHRDASCRLWGLRTITAADSVHGELRQALEAITGTRGLAH